jgi:sugar/nucleoside kinase (ribokinase family)
VRPVAVIGNLARDIVDGQPPRAGGAPFHCARALRLLARPSRVVTKCADVDAAALLRPLIALGVPVSWQASTSTAGFSIAYRGEERRMEVDALGESWSPDEVRGWVAAALGRCEWVHVAPLARSDFPAETLAELGRGRRLSLDGQGLVRPARTGPLQLDSDFDPEVLRHVSVLKLAAEEAEQLVSLTNCQSLAQLGVPEILVTYGSRGALVCAPKHNEHVVARAVPSGVDPTGAGDAFSAAYVVARSRGEGPVAAARLATSIVAAVLSQRTR